jgi:imidazolonepropionase-like amidohydrolase
MRVVGHIPGRGEGRIEAWFQPGYDLVAHAEEYAYQTKSRNDADIQHFVDVAKRNGTWLTATLITNQRILEQMRNPAMLKDQPGVAYVNPTLHGVWLHANPYTRRATPERIAAMQDVVAFNDRLVKAFADAGIPVLAGTDTLVSGLAPGAALHEELEALAHAGLTPRQILEAATRQSAEWLGVAQDRGAVEVGKRADLVLLTADPLADVANTRKIAAVMVGGRFYSRRDLDERLADFARRYAELPRVDPTAGMVPTGGRVVDLED